MDPTLEPHDAPREGVPAGLANQPLLAAAWRLLRADARARAESAQREERLWLALAEAIWQAVALLEADTDARGNGERRQAADRLVMAAEALGLRLVGAPGEQYEGSLLEVLQNVAQTPGEPGAPPQVAEVLAPAVLYQDRVLRLGRAVIAHPPPAPGENQGS